MRFARFILPALVVLLLIYLVLLRVPAENFHRQQYLAMGTLVEITVRDSDRSKATAAMGEVGRQLTQFGLDWHPSNGERLAVVNQQLAEKGEAWVPPEMEPVFAHAQDLSRRSGGLFDPAVGALVALWGFNQEERNVNMPPPRPTVNERIKALKPFWILPFEDGVLNAPPSTLLDFGAFAKGHAVDLAIEALREAGIKHAIVNAGGDLRVLGRHSLRRWSVGIRHPRTEGQQAIATIDLDDNEAAFTSGDYERFFLFKGPRDKEAIRYHHILDPQTGFPTSGCMSATVISDNAATADAAATALCIAGERRWRETMESLGTPLAMIITPEGKILMSEAMAERVEFTELNQYPIERVALVPLTDQ